MLSNILIGHKCLLWQFFFAYILFRSKFQWDFYCKFCSFSRLTFHMNPTIHQFDKGFHDRKTKTCTADFILRSCMFSGKFIEDMWKVFRGHSNSSIFADKYIPCFFIIEIRLINSHMNRMTVRSILDGIAHDIQIYFLELCLITKCIFMLNICIDRTVDTFHLDIRF